MTFLKDSISNKIDFSTQFSKNQQKGLLAETLLDLIRDAYFFSQGEHPKMRASQAFGLIFPNATDAEKELIDGIELSSRNRERFEDFSSRIDLELAAKVLERIKGL